MSKVMRTMVVRDYENGGQLVTIDGHDRYVKYHCIINNVEGPQTEGFDEVWFDVNGKVVKIHTNNGIVHEYND